MIALVLGGIGLFLLGMILLTDGLKALAGNALQRFLSRFVGGPWEAVASGAAITVLVQSSTATTLTTIGFVSAGLITFPESIGLIVGAALGTTSTGWIVSILGLKVSFGGVALPVVGIGALLRLLGRDRVAAAGLAMAGFGLIFVGIDALQGGMEELSHRFDLAAIPGDTIGHRLLLALTGAGMTVVMQSSSAAVATTLTALHAGAISLPQAAALVVGQNVGTAMTSAIAGMGASVAAKRTATVHVLFNSFVGLVAFFAIPVFLFVAEWSGDVLGVAPGAVAIAAFHTSFNALGVLLITPWMARFARVVERLVPEHGPNLTRRLDPNVARLAPVAVEAARLTLLDILATLVAELANRVRRGVLPVSRLTTETAARATEETRTFLGLVRTDPELEAEHQRHVAVLSGLDHLSQLLAICGESPTLESIEGDASLRQALGRAARLARRDGAVGEVGWGGCAAARGSRRSVTGRNTTSRP